MTSRGMLAAATGLMTAFLFAGGTASAATAKQQPSALKGDAHSKAEATHRAELMLGRVHVPGAVLLPPATSGFTLTSPGELSVQLVRVYSVPGTTESVIHQIRLHPPRGFHNLFKTLHVAPFGHFPGATTLDEEPADRQLSQMHTISFDARRSGTGRVMLTVTAEVLWDAARSPLEHVPAGATVSLQLTPYALPTDPTVAVSAVEARELKAGLNRLDTTNDGELIQCWTERQHNLKLRFRYGGHDAVFEPEVGGCNAVEVTIDGKEQPPLADDRQLLQLIRHLVGHQL